MSRPADPGDSGTPVGSPGTSEQVLRQAEQLNQEAHVSGGGSAYQAGRDQVFHFEDRERGAWQTEAGTPDAECPYPGLAAFGPDQARWFFGRREATAQLTGELADRLRRGGALMVIGPSGAGKSSLLRAGLVPAIRRGGLPAAGAARWPLAVFAPTADPLAELAAQYDKLCGAKEMPDDRIILIVDQFEEIFALCPDEHERRTFVARLCELAAGSPAAALIVLGLRADFYAQAAQYPELRDVLRDGPVLLDPMSEAELRQAIMFPARDVGLDIEPGLVEVLLRDLGAGEPIVLAAADRAGRLPLLAHALRVTWQERRGHLLTVEGYQATGGIERAIATTADRTYNGLGPAAQEAARRMFLRLIAIGDGTADARRRLSRAELLGDLGDSESAVVALDTFTQHRLLIQEQDAVTITHEALLHSWPMLRGWINSDRVGNVIRQDLDTAARRWERDGRDQAALYRGSRLASARSWAATHDRDLSGLTSAFLAISVRHELRAARTRRAAAVVLAVLTVIATVTAVVALQQRGQAIRQRNAAIISQLTTDASQLQASDPSLADQLTLVAHRMQPANPEFDSNLIAAENTTLSTPLTGHTGQVWAVAFSRTGHVLATGGRDGTVQLWNVADPARPRTFGPPVAGREGIIWSVAFSPDGRTMAGAASAGRLLLWDVNDPAHPVLIRNARVSSSGLTSVAFSAAGHILATGSSDGSVRLWNVADPADPVPIGSSLDGANGQTSTVAFSPDGRILAIGNFDDELGLWDVADPSRPHMLGHLFTTQTAGINSVAFSPNGKILASGSNDATTQLWNVADAAKPTAIGQALNSHDGEVFSVAFSPDGSVLATGDYDDTIRLWNVKNPYSAFLIGRPISGHSAIVSAVAFSPDGTMLASGSWDHTARLWSIPRTILNLVSVDSVAFSPNGRVLAAGSFDGTIRLFDVSDPARPALIAGPLDSQAMSIWSVAFSPDGRILAAGSADHTVRLWKVADPAHPVPIGNPLVAGVNTVRSLAFSPVGHLLATAILATGRVPGKVLLWDVTNPAHPVLAGPPLQLLTASGYSVAFSRDGRLLAAQDALVARLWNVARPSHPVALGETPLQMTGVLAVAFSPDGKFLADSDFANMIHLWNISNPARLTAIGQPLTGPTDTIGSLAFSPHRGLLASGSQDESVQLWNTADPGQARPDGEPLTGHINTIWSVAWSPDGNILASGSIDGTIRLWDLRLSSAQRWICRAAGGALTRAEWQHYLPDLPYQPVCPQ